MSPGYIDRQVVAARLELVDELLALIRALPLSRPTELRADARNIATIESCLRRALEAVFDVGRHLVAKGFGRGVVEYRAIASALADVGVLDAEQAATMIQMAGYRNRMVHLYHDVTEDELVLIAQERLGDIEVIANAYRAWIAAHPDRLTPDL